MPPDQPTGGLFYRTTLSTRVAELKAEIAEHGGAKNGEGLPIGE
jgi:hypothetical protein